MTSTAAGQEEEEEEEAERERERERERESREKKKRKDLPGIIFSLPDVERESRATYRIEICLLCYVSFEYGRLEVLPELSKGTTNLPPVAS